MNIKLSESKEAIIDEEDATLVAGKKWCLSNYGYATRTIKNRGSQRGEYMHRVILGVTDSKVHVDHINGNRLDNRRVNLRTCAHPSQNQYNQKKQRRVTSSKFKGVTFDKSRGLWMAKIKRARLIFNLGRFHDEVDAAVAYNNAALELFGEFAKLNEIPEPREKSVATFGH